MKTRLKLSAITCIVASFLLCNQVFAAETNTQKTVRLGYVNVQGYEEGLEGEIKSGFGYEYFQKISYQTNWKYEYVYGTFSELITKLSKGEIDLLGNVSYMPERAQVMNFSHYPMGAEKYYLFSKTNNKKYAGADIIDISGATIGVEGKKYSATVAKEWIEAHELKANFKEYDNSANLINGLEADEVDLMVMTDAAEGYGYQPVQLLGFKDYYFAVAKNREDLLLELEDALGIIQGNSPHFNAIIESKYVKNTIGSSYLGKKEKNWLSEHNNTIRIGYLDNNLPYSGLSETGELQGYLLALVHAMEEYHHITVETKAYQSIYDIYNASKTGQIDVYGPAYSTHYLSETYGIMQTDSIMETQAVIVFKGNEIKENKIAVSNRTILFDKIIKMNHPESEIILCNDYEDCVRAVVSGKADCMIIPASMLNRLHQYRDFKKLNSADMNESIQICMFTQKGNLGLLNILDKSILLAAPELRGSSYMIASYTEANKTFAEAVQDNLITFTLLTAVVLFALIFFLIKTSSAEHETAELNKSLEIALAQANQANEAKSTFLSNMSHDIRTPLNAILGFTTLLQKEDYHTPQIDDYLNKIQESGAYLLTVINNVLDMARIDSGKMELDENFSDLLSDKNNVVALLSEEINKKNIHYTTDVNIQHRYVLLDIAKNMQITMNLLSNAIKYTPEGGNIHLSYNEIPGAKEGYARYTMTVKDDGIGMTKEFQKHIFDSFARERNTTDSKVAGTGLGMAIVKKLVDLTGGTISVESKLGEGSTFIYTADFKIVDNPETYLEETSHEKSSIVDLNGKRVLLTEDNELNSEIATAILEEFGMIVERAEDGIQCLDMLKKAKPYYYDLILMDIQMPNLNGYDTTKKIRNSSVPGKTDIPIIAMTANAFEEDKQFALKAGMNGHIAKPIDVSQLITALGDIFED